MKTLKSPAKDKITSESYVTHLLLQMKLKPEEGFAICS
jgi:hypothetical protein